MSKIVELIKNYCPTGVQKKSLAEIGVILGGMSGKSKDDFAGGNSKYITYMNIYKNPQTDLNVNDYVNIKENENQHQLKKGDVLFTGSSETPDECGISSVVCDEILEPIYLNSFCFIFRTEEGIFNPHFLKHLFRSYEIRNQIGKTANGVTRYNVSKKLFAKVEIPIPPMEVQNEIARILDNFSELEARKQQHKYYFNELISADFNNSTVRKTTVNETLLSMSTGLNPRQNFKLNTVDAENFYVTIKELDGKNLVFLDKTDKVNDRALQLINKRSKLDKNDVLFSGTGTIGVTYLVTEKPSNWDIKEGIYVLKPNTDLILPSYLRYILISEPFIRSYQSKISGSSVNSLPMKVLRELTIPLPSLSEQRKRVDILEKFEGLLYDLNDGLPAEIAARRKQYEYYRNKLLTF